MNLAFVTHFCPHYRVRTFEILSSRVHTDFLFFSSGDQWYWPERFGVMHGDFPHEYLPAVKVGRTHVSFALLRRLLATRYDAIIKCINGRFAVPAVFALCRLRRTPFILWTGIWHNLHTPFHRLFRPVMRYIYRHADALVVYGDHVKRFLIDVEGVNPERIFVAAHATDHVSYGQHVSAAAVSHLRSTLAIDSHATVLLYAGRLVTAKGLWTLLDAFAQVRGGPVLVLVGSGAERDRLESYAHEHGFADRLRWVTDAKPNDMVQYYAMADLLILPSITTATFREPWGLVVNEGFYQGLPAVVTDAVGAARGGLVEDGVTGLIVREGHADELAEAVQKLVSDPILRESLGRNAKQRVQEWSNDRMVEGFLRAVSYVTGRSLEE